MNEEMNEQMNEQMNTETYHKSLFIIGNILKDAIYANKTLGYEIPIEVIERYVSISKSHKEKELSLHEICFVMQNLSERIFKLETLFDDLKESKSYIMRHFAEMR